MSVGNENRSVGYASRAQTRLHNASQVPALISTSVEIASSMRTFVGPILQVNAADINIRAGIYMIMARLPS